MVVAEKRRGWVAGRRRMAAWCALMAMFALAVACSDKGSGADKGKAPPAVKPAPTKDAPVVATPKTVMDGGPATKLAPSKILPPVHVKAMAGPYPTLKAYCKATAPKDGTRKCKPKKQVSPSIEVLPPFDKVRLFLTSEDIMQDVVIAVKTKSGWFTYDVEWAIAGMGQKGSTKLRKVRIADVVPGGLPELQVGLTWIHVKEGYHGLRDEPTKHKQKLVCGIGPSNKPSCVVLTEAYRFTSNQHDKKTDRYFSLDFSKPGTLVVSNKKGRTQSMGEEDGFKKYVGTHPLVFP